MSDGDVKGTIAPSVLDRLLDDEPDRSHDPPQSQAQEFRMIENAVRRDLENLLNTRVRCVPLPTDLPEIHNTIVTYGVADVTSSHLQSKRRKTAYFRQLEETIRKFEPRFDSVKITPLDNANATDATLRFQISAELRHGSAARTIVFDSSMEPSGPFKLQGGTG